MYVYPFLFRNYEGSKSASSSIFRAFYYSNCSFLITSMSTCLLCKGLTLNRFFSPANHYINEYSAIHQRRNTLRSGRCRLRTIRLFDLFALCYDCLINGLSKLFKSLHNILKLYKCQEIIFKYMGMVQLVPFSRLCCYCVSFPEGLNFSYPGVLSLLLDINEWIEYQF